jgi:hypothetical protein
MRCVASSGVQKFNEYGSLVSIGIAGVSEGGRVGDGVVVDVGDDVRVPVGSGVNVALRVGVSVIVAVWEGEGTGVLEMPIVAGVEISTGAGGRLM